RRDLPSPKGSVIAAQQYGEILLQAQLYMKPGDGQFRHIRLRVAQHKIHDGRGTPVRQESQKVTLVADGNGQPGRDTLGTRFGARVSDHFQDMRAADPEGGSRQK